MTPSSPEEAPASPTPRTEAARIDNADLHDVGYGLSEMVAADFARQLERELAALRQRLEAAELDTKRLDWLEKTQDETDDGEQFMIECSVTYNGNSGSAPLFPATRSGIDAAMKASQPQSPTP
jgi:hypothetical protein